MKLKFEDLSNRVIGCAIEVHRLLGPGLLESSYSQCLSHEFSSAGIQFVHQKNISVVYKGTLLDCAYKADFIVENNLIIELKSIEQFMRVHEAQLLTYMRHAKVSVGLLINFNVTLLKLGLKRYVL